MYLRRFAPIFQGLTLQNFGYPCMEYPSVLVIPYSNHYSNPFSYCFYLVLGVPQSIPRSLAIWVFFAKFFYHVC